MAFLENKIPKSNFVINFEEKVFLFFSSWEREEKGNRKRKLRLGFKIHKNFVHFSFVCVASSPRESLKTSFLTLSWLAPLFHLGCLVSIIFETRSENKKCVPGFCYKRQSTWQATSRVIIYTKEVFRLTKASQIKTIIQSTKDKNPSTFLSDWQNWMQSSKWDSELVLTYTKNNTKWLFKLPDSQFELLS